MSLFPGTPIHLVLALTGWFVLSWLVRPRTAAASWWRAALATLISATFALGCLTYPSYRTELKPGLLQQHPQLASLFETKEHLAAMTLCLVLGGLGVWASAGGLPEGRRASLAMLRLGWVLYSAVVLLGLTVTWLPS